MATIRILCKTAACFVNPETNENFKIDAKDRLILRDAPAWIQKDKLFGWMLNDGTLEVVNATATQKELENDPVQGANAEGKKTKGRGRAKKEEAHTDEISGAEPDPAPEAASDAEPEADTDAESDALADEGSKE